MISIETVAQQIPRKNCKNEKSLTCATDFMDEFPNIYAKGIFQ